MGLRRPRAHELYAEGCFALLLLLPLLGRCDGAYAEVPRGGGAEAVDVHRFGIAGDGIQNDSAALQQLLRERPAAHFYFPRGMYLLHNGTGLPGMKLEGFHGTITMDKDAAFLCDTAEGDAGQCIWVVSSKGAAFEGVTVRYLPSSRLPLQRESAISNAILVERSRDIRFSNTTVLGSTGSGIWNTDSVNVSFSGRTEIRNTSADGLHFENVGHGSVENLFTFNTGDDALAVTNIAKDHPNCGFIATHIVIRESHARGIATAGACDASFANIDIDGTANSAIAITRDQEISSRSSSHVSVVHADVRDAGQLKAVHGNRYCVDIADSQDVAIFDLRCENTLDDGVMIYNHARNIRVTDVQLKNSGNNGFQAVDGAASVWFLRDTTISSAQNGFDIEGSDHVKLRSCESSGAGGYGFYHSSSSAISEQHITARNSARRAAHGRAWWAESMRGPIKVEGLIVIDDQRKTKGLVGDDHGNSVSPVVRGRS